MSDLCKLTLTRPIGLPTAPVAQKIADQCWLIAHSSKNRPINRYLFYINDVIKGWLVLINIVFLFNLIRSNKL